MRAISALLLLCMSLLGMAQADAAELFYSSGKIYVVVAVLLIIFTGIVVYLVRLDKKITKLEKENEA